MIWLLLSLNFFAFFVIPEGNLPKLGFFESSEKRVSGRSAFRRMTKESEQKVVAWLTEQDHDFGELQQGRPASFVFKFKNIATDTILLQTARTTCGCTAARYTEEPIAPGAAGEIAVVYDAYQSGAFSKKIKVFFDKQKKAETLWIRGEVN
jgi:hypothetical protein